MIAPIAIAPPAPNPQTARARIKLRMLRATAHYAVPSANTAKESRNGGRRPKVSDIRPNVGWKAVDVSKNDVDNQDAEFDE
jgi:hypothetical protein